MLRVSWHFSRCGSAAPSLFSLLVIPFPPLGIHMNFPNQPVSYSPLSILSARLHSQKAASLGRVTSP